MKKLLVASTLFIFIINSPAFAQKKKNREQNTIGERENNSYGEQHGRILNLGAGFVYYSNVGRPVPMFMLNYEFDVVKNFTLAPFIGFYTYTNNYYWGNKNYPDRYYPYRVTVVPLGVKGAYYFDDLLHANQKWDFYAAASIGFAFRSITWDSDYYGDQNAVQEASPLYAALHIGARYHINQNIGAFLDFSTGFSTIGLSFKI
jgi:hypothetical protein